MIPSSLSLPQATLVHWTKKIIVEEGHTVAQLTHMLQLLCRHYKVYFPVRQHLVQHMISSIQRLGLTANVSNFTSACQFVSTFSIWLFFSRLKTFIQNADFLSLSVRKTSPTSRKRRLILIFSFFRSSKHFYQCSKHFQSLSTHIFSSFPFLKSQNNFLMYIPFTYVSYRPQRSRRSWPWIWLRSSLNGSSRDSRNSRITRLVT